MSGSVVSNDVFFTPFPFMPATNRTFWIDLIRVAGAFFVVMLHVSYRVAGGPMVEDAGDAFGSLGWLTTRCFRNFGCGTFFAGNGALKGW